MANELAQAHIEAERRLRVIVSRELERVWGALPGYDRENLDEWLGRSVPLVAAAQRQSALITDAYLARAMGRRAIGLDMAELIGAAVRNGTAPTEVYTRPFVTVWTALGTGTEFARAVDEGLARATAMARWDVQATMRQTADYVERRDPTMFGFKRVADPTACDFCKEVNGAYVKGADGIVMGLHNNCGCGLEPLRDPHAGATLLPDGERVRDYQYGPVAVHEHGEMGPVLADPAHAFTGPDDF